MAGGGTFCLLLLDSFVRRLVLPLCLVAAVIFRYNAVSLVYLLFLLASFLLPTTRNSSHSVFPLLHQSLLVVLSLVATLVQVLFQVILVTDYSNEFEPCTFTESAWRQSGFILFGSGNETLYSGPPVADVLRNFLIDVGMFAVSLTALIITAVTVAQLRKQPKSLIRNSSAQPAVIGETDLSTESPDSPTAELHSLSHSDEEERPPSGNSTKSPTQLPSVQQQPFIQVPTDLLFLLEVVSISFLVLSASAVPSVTAIVYLLVFLLLALLWSIHVTVSILKFVIWTVTMAFVGVHLVVLYIFQLQSLQEAVNSMDSNTSMALRLSGVTPWIVTNCSQPTELRLSDEAIYSWYLNPIFLLLLFATAALNFRLRVFKPKVTWNSKNVVFFPSFTPRYWASYSYAASDTTSIATRTTDVPDGYTVPSDGASADGGRKGKSTWLQVLTLIREVGIAISFGLALVSMMAWSIAFPSWLSLILLLWACCIWLFPKLNAKWALLYTSPLLLLFSTVLLALQYITYLNLIPSEVPSGLRVLISRSIVTEPYEPLLHFPLVFLQFVLVGSFFLAVYTLVDEVIRRRLRKRESRIGHRVGEDSADVGNPPPLERQITLASTMVMVNTITERLYKYVCYYWVLVTMAAFLLASFVGDPTLFKAVYMIGFVLSLLIYQVLPSYWYKVCVPMWGLFIVYSFCELTIIYIYQLEPVFSTLNNRLSQNGTLLMSIGFPHIPKGEVRFSIAQLLRILLPPTVFIAVMASQLRYFYPKPWDEDRKNVGLEAAGEDARSLLVSAHHTLHARVRQTKKKPPSTAREDIRRSEAVGRPSGEVGGEPPESTSDASKGVSFGAADKSDKDVTRSKWEKAKQTTSELAKFAGHWLWVWILTLNSLFWQLVEIHLHKIIALVIFSIVITQLGAILMVVLVMMVLTSPLRQMNRFFYPVFTAIIGCIVVLKMVYQVPIITPEILDLRRNNCLPLNVTAYAKTLSGPVLGNAFSPRGNDSNWFGFHKLTEDSFVAYISGYIAVLLLLAFWFVVRRRMARHRASEEGAVNREERGSLFPGITRNEAESNILMVVKYSVNHAFDYYGAEICCCLLAITMAVRDDVYSVIYGIILGLCLILTVTPRALVILLWPFLTYAVGFLIVIQYAFLLGAPDGACFRPNATTALDYPWTANPAVSVQLRKWLYLSDYADILNRDYLYADFITFLAMCLKTFRIFRGAGVALNLAIGDEWDGTLKGYWTARKYLVILQTIVYGNWFWLCVLFLFFTGAVNASLWGFVYFLMSFAMGWWGRQMLASNLSRVRLSWEIVRAIVLLLMVTRATLQVIGCTVRETSLGDHYCPVLLVLRAKCSQRGYFYNDGVDPDCNMGEVVGLALDAVLFIVLSIQIVIIQSKAFGNVQVAYRKKLAKSHVGARIFDDLVKQRLIDSIHEQRTQVKQVNARISLLQAHLGRLLAHKMHVGVRVPKDIKILKSNQSSQATSEAGTPLLDRPPDQPYLLRRTLEPKPEDEIDSSAGIWHTVKSYIRTAYGIFLNWLEQQSEIYRRVQEGLERSMTPERDEASARDLPGGDVSTGGSDLFGGSEAVVERGPGAVGESAARTQQPQTGSKGEDAVDSIIPLPTSSADRRKEDEDLVDEKPKLESAGDADLHISLELTDSGDVEKKRKAYTKSGSVDEILDEVETIGSKIARLIRAIYYYLIANTAHICYFFVIMNIIFNGSVLSLMYAIILFFWGLLTIPYPTQRFWLVMIFYTMLVVLVKYGFQFQDFSAEELALLETNRGLPVLKVLGIEKADNFLTIAVWDILLLLSLILHRALLKETGLWRKKSLRFAIISEIREEVEEKDEPPSTELLSDSEEFGKDVEDAPIRSPEEEPIVHEVEESWQAIDEIVTQESITIWKKITQTIRQGLYRLYKFYVKAISPNITFGARDFYILSFVLDSICFCIFVLGFSAFGLGQGELQQVATYIQQNSIPLPFLIVLLLQFLSMLMDRLIYLRKSLPMKLIFNVFLIVVWHAYLFFILPHYTARPFLDNSYAQAIYFFKAWYFIVSSFQIVSGYPHRVLGYFWGKTPNLVNGTILLVYRFIPIIPLLREVMDWTMTRTSLRLKHYLTVQEIYGKLFLTSMYRRWDRESPRNLGQPSSFLVRLAMGGGFISVLVLLIWGPLLVISAISATNIANPPVDFSIELSISGFPALLTLAAQRRFIQAEISQEMFDDLQNRYQDNLDVMNQFSQNIFQRVQFTRIVMEGEGSLLWTITNPARRLLLSSLDDSTVPLDLIFKWTITRNPPNGLVAERVQGRRTINLDTSLRDSLIEALTMSSNVTIPGLFPRIITGPANGESKGDTVLNSFSGDTSSSVTCQLVHINASNGEFWSLKQNIQGISASRHLLKNDSDPTPNSLEFIIFSERVSLPEFDILVGQGIIGLYTAIVLVIANFLRDWVSSLFYQLPYDEMPNPDHLLELCQDIFIARESGELAMEEILAGHLIFILRSNAKLLEWTKPIKQD